VVFLRDLSWCHGAGHEVKAGDTGELAWRFHSGGQERLAIWWQGVLLHSVPADAVKCGANAALTENLVR